ncbi:5186_t:CDS:1, partial [Ambispora leptoticha]
YINVQTETGYTPRNSHQDGAGYLRHQLNSRCVASVGGLPHCITQADFNMKI